MTTPQARAGKKLSAATKKQIDDATGHLQRAMERHKALRDQMDNIKEQSGGDEDKDTHADLADLHEDANDAHRALGRSLKACQRCLRSALKNKPPASDDNSGDDGDEDEIETSAGDGQQDDTRSADQRRRDADLQALAQKH